MMAIRIRTVPASKVSINYHSGDDICAHGDLVLPPHLTRCLDPSQEASFVVAQSGLA
jgi:cutinase